MRHYELSGFMLHLLFFLQIIAPSFTFARGWQQDVSYQIQAKLDTTAKNLRGDMLLTYKNNSPDTLRHFYLLIPANAFYNEGNTAVREMHRFNQGNIQISRRPHPKITITSLQFFAIGEHASFPLQAFDFNDTILDLPLPYPLQPGDSLALGLHFVQDYLAGKKTKGKPSIPSTFLQWFPRVAVYDQKGWHAEPFHFMMDDIDIFSEFARMDVTLTVPGNFIIVASGRVIEGDPGWKAVRADTSWERAAFVAWHDSTKNVLKQKALQHGNRTVRFSAEKQHNFIWSASPDLVHYQANARVPVHIFFHGNRSGQSRWAKEAQKNIRGVMAFLEDYLSPYPFDHLSIVHGNRQAAQPMLIVSNESGDFSLVSTLATLYVPGIVATNGIKESWLAKGLSLFLAKKSSELKHGKQGYDLKEAKKDMSWLERQYPLPTLDNLFRNFARLYMNSGQNEPIANSIYKYKDPLSMVFNVYLKADIFYEMLQFVVGDSIFKEILREFVRQHAFSYAGEKELRAISAEVSGQDLSWFFNQWLYRTPVVDYEKGKVKQYQQDDKKWITEVEVKRKGDGIMPVEVEVELRNGKKMVQRWDGRGQVGKLIFKTAEKPGSVKVDPENRIMDNNYLNNGHTRLEFRPDLPLLRLIHIPSDAYLILWRPIVDYNSEDGLRLGLRTKGSYQVFFNNLTLQTSLGIRSLSWDGKIAYSHPLQRKNLMNRYTILARKKEGRFETEMNLFFKGSKGILTSQGRQLKIGLNYSGLLDSSYTFLQMSNDTGKVQFQEWDDVDVFMGYAEGQMQTGGRHVEFRGRFRAEATLPGSEAQFFKIRGRIEEKNNFWRFSGRLAGNAGISFGPDPLPRQDRFRAEGASPRERFHNDILKTNGEFLSFSRRFVEGDGFLRGYAGMPLPVEKYLTANIELGLARPFLGFRWFGFYDTGLVWENRNGPSRKLANAGIAFSFLRNGVSLFGGNLPLFQGLSLRVYLPIWLSSPLPGEKQTQFRWYFSLGKQLF